MEPTLGWGESGYFSALPEPEPGHAEPPLWDVLALLPDAPRDICPGAALGSSWARGRQQTGYDLILCVCLFFDPQEAFTTKDDINKKEKGAF